MAAASKHHDLLKIGGAAVAAFAGYEFVYKPWKAAQDAALLTGTATPAATGISSLFTPSILPPVSSMVTTPLGIQPSNLNPGALVGGIVGACIQKSGNTWTAQQCTDKLNAITTAYANAQAAIAALGNSAPNPQAVAGVAAANLQLQQEIAARDTAIQQAALNTSQGDTQGAATWNAAVAVHNQDISELQSRISASSVPVDNSAAIAAWQGAIAGLKTEYFNHTGQVLA